MPRLVTGQFDPTIQKAVWPSTGNYCRGGAYDSALLACESIAILPEGMSKERFEWLSTIAGETIKTPGSESNVKEIFDKCKELRASGQDLMIFNRFEEFGNYLWHYEVTGHAMEEVLQQVMGPKDEFRGMTSATGSAGTIASGDYMKQRFPSSKIAASEALQCPTLLENGFGAHRITFYKSYKALEHPQEDISKVIEALRTSQKLLIKYWHPEVKEIPFIDEALSAYGEGSK